MFHSKKQVKEIECFRNALYLFLLYKVAIYVSHFNTLFSSNKLITNHSQSIGSLNDLAFLLNNHSSVWLAKAAIVSLGVLSLIGLLKKSNYFTNLCLWLLVINLSNALYPTLTAGDYLLNQLLLFNVFFSTSTTKSVALNDMKTALHNTALIGIKLQLCLAYFLAGWFKLIDDSWMSGMAVYQTFQIQEYSTAFLQALPLSICKVLNYSTIVYQLLLPFLIWIRPLKIYLLGFGLLQHLCIAFGMGLFSFGIIMIICYILFLKYDNKF